MKMNNPVVLAAMMVLASVIPSHAQDKPEEGKGVEVSLGGYYRVRHYFIEDAGLTDASGSIYHTNTSYFQQRLRLDPTIRVGENVRIVGQVDIFDDVIFGNNDTNIPALAGSPTSQGSDGSFQDQQFGWRSINPKRFYADVQIPFGRLEFGRMPSQWGLGILENDGNGFKNEWGDAHFGSTDDRILFATKPLGKDGPFIAAIGFDKKVTANTNTVMASNPNSIDQNLGEVQRLFIVPAYSSVDKKATLGVFAAYNSQDSTKTNLFQVSGYGDADLDPVRIQLEAVWQGGTTEALADAINAFNTAQTLNLSDKADVNALNAVLRATYSLDPFKAVLEGGFASAQARGELIPDQNSSRIQITGVPMNPDYNVGLIMFKELLFRKTAEAAARYGSVYPTSDPRNALTGLISTNGGVSNAWYVAPLFKFDLTEAFGMKLGFLYARALEDIVDPTTGPNWKNYNGGAPSKEMGWEVDWGLHFALADNFDVGVQLGYMIPGKAFYDAAGGKVNIFETQTRLTVAF